jgi:hypothetical protein
MKVITQDGRVFAGTALQIVRDMQSISFVKREAELADYIEWVACSAQQYEGVELRVAGTTDEDRAAALLSELLRTGLARRG